MKKNWERRRRVGKAREEERDDRRRGRGKGRKGCC